MSALQMSIITAGAIGLACAALSVFVILRRWAFIGEGIAHAGFGGAGTAWVLSLLFPGVVGLRTEGGIYCIAAIFCLIAFFPAPLWVDLLVYLAVVITIISGIDYFFGLRKVMREASERQLSSHSRAET